MPKSKNETIHQQMKWNSNLSLIDTVELSSNKSSSSLLLLSSFRETRVRFVHVCIDEYCKRTHYLSLLHALLQLPIDDFSALPTHFLSTSCYVFAFCISNTFNELKRIAKARHKRSHFKYRECNTN